MHIVVFKDVFHMMSPAGNHPDVRLQQQHSGLSGPHHGSELQSGVNNLLWTSCIFLMKRGVLIATRNSKYFLC